MEDLIRALESSFARSDLPRVKPGDTVRVYVKVKEIRVNPKTRKPEEKVRLQAYEGVVIAERGKGIGKSIVVRKMSSGIGVERIFPLSSPSVDRIEIVKRAKVRRANLGYLRGRVGKHAKLRDRRLSPEEISALAGVAEAKAEEAPEAPAVKAETEEASAEVKSEETPEAPAEVKAEETPVAPPEAEETKAPATPEPEEPEATEKKEGED